MDQQAIFLTLRLASVTTLILLAIAVPLGYWLAYAKARWKPLVEAAVALPLVLPPTVLGFYLLVLMAPRTAAGIGAISTPMGHVKGIEFLSQRIGPRYWNTTWRSPLRASRVRLQRLLRPRCRRHRREPRNGR